MTDKTESGDRNRSISETSETEYDPEYTPIISLPEVVIPTNEEEEEVVEKLRAKLYRFDKSDDTAEWKERGTGEVKLLKHKVNKTVRIVMRRDKTLKVCANHFITPLMELKPKAGLDKAFVYNVPADFSDEEIKSECLAIRFANVEFAQRFKVAFNESQDFVKKQCSLYNGTEKYDSSSDQSTNSNSDIEEDDDDVKACLNKSNKQLIETVETAAVVEKLSDLAVTSKAVENSD